MKTVLIASYYFPPYADVAGVRAIKFSKFLPQNDWCTLVATVDKKYYGEKITKSVPKEHESTELIFFPYIRLPFNKFLSLLLFPIYIFLVVFKRRNIIDSVLISGSPFHPFLLTPFFSIILNIPTILDFRDSWSHRTKFDGRRHDGIHLIKTFKKYIYFIIEKVSLKYATYATFATSTLRDEYIELIPQFKIKYHVINNGFDPDDFKNLDPVFLKQTQSIILTGKFLIYTPQAAKEFFDILATIPEVTFIYVGNECEDVRLLASECNISDRVITIEHQPYSYALQLIKGSDYCLLSNGLKNGMGTKIYDYLALNKPTLCLVPKDSIITKTFSTEKGVIVCEAPHTRQKLEKDVRRLMQLEQDKESRMKIIDKYSRQRATEELSRLLDSAIKIPLIAK